MPGVVLKYESESCLTEERRFADGKYQKLTSKTK